MSNARTHRLDDLRRFATALVSAAGVPPARASALSGHLLWYDAAGAPSFGIATLPCWLERLSAGALDPSAEGKVTEETLGTAMLDGQNGLAPLVLARAGELAIEKARDAGTGLVRVAGIEPPAPAADLVAGMAIGPVVAVAVGPGPSWALALPTDDGLPAVYDASLASEPAASRTRKPGRSPRTPPDDGWVPWLAALVPEGGWLVAAIGIKTFEPLSTFQARVGARVKAMDPGAGRLLPQAWEAHRSAAREHGVAVTDETLGRLNDWAKRLAVPPLSSPAQAPSAAS